MGQADKGLGSVNIPEFLFLCQRGAFYMEFRFPAVFALAYVGVLAVVPLAITLISMRSFSKEALVERLRGAEN